MRGESGGKKFLLTALAQGQPLISLLYWLWLEVLHSVSPEG